MLQLTTHSWIANDNSQQKFWGYFITDIHHKTLKTLFRFDFFVLEHTTSPKMLLSYVASGRLGIIELKIPNETPPTALDAITHVRKYVSLSNSLHRHTCKQHNKRPASPPKTEASHSLQDHHSWDHSSENKKFQDHSQKISFQDHSPQKPSFQYHSSQKQSLQDYSSQKPSLQGHITTENVQDIIALKQAFLQSLDRVGDMSGTYTICTDPFITCSACPLQGTNRIQGAHRESPSRHCRFRNYHPCYWTYRRVSSLTYPHQPNGSLHICFDPCDLNKAIIREHYKAPTFEEISHKLSGATVFSKLDATKMVFDQCTWTTLHHI